MLPVVAGVQPGIAGKAGCTHEPACARRRLHLRFQIARQVTGANLAHFPRRMAWFRLSGATM